MSTELRFDSHEGIFFHGNSIMQWLRLGRQITAGICVQKRIMQRYFRFELLSEENPSMELSFGIVCSYMSDYKVL